MKKNHKGFNGSYYKLLTVIFILLSIFTASFQFATAKNNEKVEENKEYTPGQLIVKFEDGMGPDAGFLKAHNVSSAKKILKADKNESKTAKSFKKFGIDRIYLVDLSSKSDLVKKMKDLNDDPKVEYAGPNYIYHTTEIPNDPSFDELWGLHNTGQSGGTDDADIDAPEAWDIHTGSNDVVIAVIDTGVDYNHPDLSANIWTNLGEIAGNGIDDDGNGYTDDIHGYDFVNNDGDPIDDNDHGTHCAGTIGAVGDDGMGIVGVNWDVRIMPVKFLSSSGSGSTANAILSVEYATDNGADIMSNSWGGGGYDSALKDAISAANDAGVLFVAAAGNTSSNNDVSPHYPSSYDVPNVIAVAATDHNDNRAGFSCYGATSVDLGAPGVSIYSTIAGGYDTYNGTSMATPHVAGAAGLIKARFPGFTATEIKSRILDEVDPISTLDGITVTGGRLNAYNSLNYISDDITPPSAVSDLAFSEVTYNSISLTWTATGDDGDVGIASKYDVRYSISEITTEEDWNNATQTVGELKPQALGSEESFTVKNLGFNTTYYFAVKVVDDVGNYSGLSNSASGVTVLDDIPPNAVSDLTFLGAEYDAVSLSWTATGDDGDIDMASEYDVRYSTSIIAIEADWNEATQAQGEPQPQSFGSEENFTIENLEFNTTYYFALKAIDKVGNYSGLSNSASGATKDVMVVFHDDMEDGVNGWTHSGAYDNWELGEPTSGPGYPYSGSNVWATDLSGDYGTNYMNAWLLSPSINLNGVESAQLTFQHYYNIENSYDGSIVEISTDGGNSWIQITPDGGYPEDALSSSYGNPLGPVPAYSGYSGDGWHQAVFDISSYDGYNNVNIRFRFGTDNSVYGYPGWYIDNVVILGEGSGENLPPIANAGPDQTISDADNDGVGTVTLDGSASNDLDGSIVSFVWQEGEDILPCDSTLSSCNYNFSVGTRIITLIIEDNEGATSSDEVIITVDPNQPPIITEVSPDQTVYDIDGTGLETVSLYNEAYDPDGTTLSYEWKEDGVILNNEPYFSHDFSVGIHEVILTVTDNGGATSTDNVVVTVVANQAPTANAGLDQNSFVGEELTFDGSGSSDSDGNIVSYEWDFDASDGVGVDVTGATTSHSYATAGNYIVTLTVVDNGGATTSDEVMVEVTQPNQVPIANAGLDQTINDADGNGVETVTLDGSASSDIDGTVVSYEWKEGETILSCESVFFSCDYDFSVGVHIVTLTVTDNEGATVSDEVVITVTEAVVQPMMHISSIDMSTAKVKLRGWYTRAVSTVTVVDTNGDPVEGVMVSGNWSGLTSDIDSNIETDSAGQAIVYSDALKKAVGTFTFTVTNVVKDGLIYNFEDNMETSNSITLSR